MRRIQFHFLLLIVTWMSVAGTAHALTVDEVLTRNSGIKYFAGSHKFYKFVSTGMQWEQAKANAEATFLEGNRGRLVEVYSASENNFVYSLGNGGYLWTGGSDKDKEGEWKWTGSGKVFWRDGNAVDGMFSHWNAGEPNNCCGGENYLHLWSYDKSWNDIYPTNCTSVIEWDANSILGSGSAPGGAAVTTWYVRTTGNDANNGTTAGTAFKTIQKAASMATEGDTIYVGAGTYDETVRPIYSGTLAKPISYIADTSGSRTGDSGTVTIRRAPGQGNAIYGWNRHYLSFDGFTLTCTDVNGANAYGVYAPWSTIAFKNCTATGWYYAFYHSGRGTTYLNCNANNNRYWGFVCDYADLIATNCNANDNGHGGFSCNGYRTADYTKETDYFGYGKVVLTNCNANRNYYYNVTVSFANLSIDGGTYNDSYYRGIALTCGKLTWSNNPSITRNRYNLQLHGRWWNLDQGRDKYTLENFSTVSSLSHGVLVYYYDMTLTNCTFSNSDDWGYVAYYSSINATNCTAENNKHGGIYSLGYKNGNYWNEYATSYNYDSNVFKNCTIQNNKYYGALTYFGRTKIDGGTFRNNEHHGVYVVYGAFEHSNSPAITGNGYGVTISNPDQERTKRSLTISGLTLTGNKWHALLVYNTDLTVTGCNISNNNAVENNGWGIVTYYCQVTVSNCTIDNNGYGGIYMYDRVPVGSNLATYNYSISNTPVTRNKTHGIYFIHYDNIDEGYDHSTRGELRITNSPTTSNGYGVYAYYTNIVLDNSPITDNTYWGLVAAYSTASFVGSSQITRNGHGMHMVGRSHKQLIGQPDRATINDLTITGNKGQSLNVYHMDLTLNRVTLGDATDSWQWTLLLYYTKLTATDLIVRNSGHGIYSYHYAWHKHYWYYYRDQSWYKDPGGWWYNQRTRLGIDENTEVAMPDLSLTNVQIENIAGQPFYTWRWNAGDWYDYSNRQKHLHNVNLQNVTITNPTVADSGYWSLQLNSARITANNVTVNNRRYGLYNSWGELNVTGSLSLNGRGKDIYGYGLWLSAPIKTNYTSADFANISIRDFWGSVSLSGGWPQRWSSNPDRITVSGVDFSRYTGAVCGIYAEYVDLTLNDCTVKNNVSYGVYAPYSQLTMARTTITDNGHMGVFYYDSNWVKVYISNPDIYGTYWRDTYWPIFVERLPVSPTANRTMPVQTFTDCRIANHSYGIYGYTSNSSRYRGLTGLNDPEWAGFEHTLSLGGTTLDTHTGHHIYLGCGKIVTTGTNSISNKGWGIVLGSPVTGSYTGGFFSNFNFSNLGGTIAISGWWPAIWQGAPQKFTFSGLNSTAATNGYHVSASYCEVEFVDCTFQGAAGWTAGFGFAKPTFKNCTLTDSKYGGVHYYDYNWVLMDYDYYITRMNVPPEHGYRTSTLKNFEHWGIDPSQPRPMMGPTFENTTISTTGPYGVHGYSWGGRNWETFDSTANDYTFRLVNTTISGPTYVGIEMYRGHFEAEGVNSISGAEEASNRNCDWGLLIRQTGDITFGESSLAKFNFNNVEWCLGFYGYEWNHPKQALPKLTLRNLNIDNPTIFHGIHTWFYDVDIQDCSIQNHKSWGFYFHLGKVRAKGLTVDGAKSNNWQIGATDYNWWKIYHTDLKRAYGDAWLSNWMIGVNRIGVTTDMFTRTMDNPVFEDCTITNAQYGIYTYGWNPADGTWGWTGDTFDDTLRDSAYTVSLINTVITGRYTEANGWQYGHGLHTARGSFSASGNTLVSQFAYGFLIYDPPVSVLDGSELGNLQVLNNGYGMHVAGTWCNLWGVGRTMQQLTVRNVLFKGNRNAGLYTAYLDATVENCDFENNPSWGAISYYVKPSYKNCNFRENGNAIFFYDYDWVHWYEVYSEAYADASWKTSYENNYGPTFAKWRIDPTQVRLKYDVLIENCVIEKLTNPNWSGYGIHGYTAMNVDDWYPLDMSKHNYTFTLKNTRIEGTGHGIDIYRAKFRAEGNNLLKKLRHSLLLYEHGETMINGTQGINSITFEEVNNILYFHQFWPAFWSENPLAYTLKNLDFDGAKSHAVQAYYCNLAVENCRFANSGGWGLYTGHTNVTMKNSVVDNNLYGVYNYDWNWVKQYYARAKAGESGMSSYLTWDSSLPKYGIDWAKKGERPMPTHEFTNCQITNNTYGIHGYSWNGPDRNWWDNDRDRDSHIVKVNNCTITGKLGEDGAPLAGHGINLSRAELIGTGVNVVRNFGSYGIYLGETPMRMISDEELGSFEITNNGWALGFSGRYDKWWQGAAYDITLKNLTVSGNRYGIAISYHNVTVDNVDVADYRESYGMHVAHCTMVADGLRINNVNNAYCGLYFYDYNWLRMYEWSSKQAPDSWGWYINSWKPWLQYLNVDPALNRPQGDLTLTNSSILNPGGSASLGVYA